LEVLRNDFKGNSTRTKAAIADLEIALKKVKSSMSEVEEDVKDVNATVEELKKDNKK